jgi:hypothetical protein
LAPAQSVPKAEHALAKSQPTGRFHSIVCPYILGSSMKKKGTQRKTKQAGAM